MNLRPNRDFPGNADLDDQLEAMARMRDDGLIGGIGISTATRSQVQHAIDIVGIVTVQNPYSLVSRKAEDVLALCREQGIAYAPRFPLGSALPGLPKVVDQPVVSDVARAHDATPAQIGLAWLLTHAPNILLIPGTSSVEHLQQNLAVADIELDSAEPTALDLSAL